MAVGKPFEKGNPGKKKGTQNKLTKTVKQTVLSVFNAIQKDPKHNLTAFAKKYPRDFYQIAAKLIPTEVKGNMTGEQKIILEVVRNRKHTDTPE
jgi:hypothetical protein